MTNNLFDVVCFGTDQQGEGRQKARTALTMVLKVDASKAESLLSCQSATLIREGISEQDAKALQTALGKIGLRCSYRPSLSSRRTLEIVPVEAEAHRQQVAACPDCGTKINAHEGEPNPELCPSCGLVFAKHERIMQGQAEREAIRRKLLHAQRLRETATQEEIRRRAETERREKLEMELRSELGLPKVIGSRTRLIGSASALFLLGIASGLLSARLLSPADDPQTPSPALSMNGPTKISGVAGTDPEQWMLQPGASGHIDPGTQLLLTMEAPTATSGNSSVAPDAAVAVGVGSEPRPFAAFGEGTLGASTIISPAYSASTERTRAAGSGSGAGTTTLSDAASSMMRTIEPGTDGVEALGVLAKEYAGRGETGVTKALLAEMRSRVEAASDDSRRVAALAQAADLHWDAGDTKQAQTLFEQGLQQADRLSPGTERVLALGALAASASRMGRVEQRDTLMRQANEEILKIDDPYRKLSAVCEMAEQYGLAGQRGGALGLLDHVVRSAHAIPDPLLRNAIYARTALAHARSGDPNGALAAIARMDGQDAQDTAVFAIIEESAKSHNAVWITELSSRLQSPRYAAASRALLGEAQAVRSGWGAEVQQTFAEAEGISKLVTRPDEKLSVLVEIAQAYARAGRVDKANLAFEAALRMAETLTEPKARSEALGAIADQEAAVLLTDQARTTSSLIADPARMAEVQRHIEDASRVASILRPGPS